MQVAHATPHANNVRDITSADAFRALSTQENAQLVDVRTHAEWLFTGTPDLSSIGKKPLLISWKHYPQFQVNPEFVAQLQAAAPDVNAPLYFMCRSGGRSLDAARAAANAGYTECYNISDGFEGDPDAKGQRNKTGGWRVSGQPWTQN